jgi:hypothetical protein
MTWVVRFVLVAICRMRDLIVIASSFAINRKAEHYAFMFRMSDLEQQWREPGVK